jgi:DNA-binding MarR family transcriptional regulator
MKNSDELISEHAFGERLDMEKYILVVLFLIQQRWTYTINNEFKQDNITTKQWLMLIVLSTAFEKPPSMQEVADAMSITHQNVKQLAVRLESQGFIKIERDKNNKRILRLMPTEMANEYWAKREEDHARSIKGYFKDLNEEEVVSLFHIMGKLEKLSGKMYLEAKNQKNIGE